MKKEMEKWLERGNQLEENHSTGGWKTYKKGMLHTLNLFRLEKD